MRQGETVFEPSEGRGLRAKRLNTRLALMPCLLMLSGVSLAGGLAPLSVSPDLIRSPLPRSVQQTPAAESVVERSGEVPVETRAAPARVELEPLHGGADTSPSVDAETVTDTAERTAAPRTGDVGAGDVAGARPLLSATPALRSPVAGAPLESGATQVSALRIVGVRAVELVAEGEAELVRDSRVLTADRVIYNELTDEATADGNVRLSHDDDWLAGDWARLIVHEWVGELDQPRYLFTRQSRARPGETQRTIVGTGGADVMYFEGENQYRMVNATWTTCEPEDPDWFIRAADLELDYDREIGVARGATLVFKDTPILWWPRMSFPLAEQRQSGFLVPTIGVSNKTGFDLAVPYYWNIAPNYDATITPRLMGRRGLQLGAEYRYLSQNYSGEIRGEWLPKDRVTGESRSLGAIQHQHRLSPRLTASVDYNWVSDDTYFEDLSSRIAVASRVNLLRQGRMVYQGGWWSAQGLLEGYQTLDGFGPYRRLPQLSLSAFRADLPAGLAFGFSGEYVDFQHKDSTVPEGRRTHLQPQLSLPIRSAAYFVTPRVSLNHTRYDLGRALAGGRDAITRTIPVFSVDSGLFFERDTNFFGQAYLQTLEPRLFYLRVPYRDQEDIPIFDSGRFDFGFAQLFSENRYVGVDRIGDANELTAAVTTRFIESGSGAERLRATLAQKFYFDDQRVSLNELGRAPVEDVRTRRRTDVLLAASGRLTQAVSVDSLWRYDPFEGDTQRFNFALRYNPEVGRVLNVGYRYARQLLDGREGLKDVDFSAQWPLGNRWYGVGRITRSLKDKRVTEAVAGVEYLSTCGCWVFRTAAHRFATDPTRTTNALFFQLELTGLGGIGPSPVNLLTRSVPGYGKINEPMSDRYFGAD